MNSYLKPGAIVAGLTALVFAFSAGAATTEQPNPAKAKCTQEAADEGVVEADEIKAYVYECLAELEAEAAQTKTAATEGEKKPAAESD